LGLPVSDDEQQKALFSPEVRSMLSSVDFDFLSFLYFWLIVFSGFLGIGRACLEVRLYSCALKYDRVTSFCGRASSRGNMWANRHAFEHNNLDGMMLFPAPNTGTRCIDHGREKHRSAIILLKNGARILWVSCSSRMDRMDSEAASYRIALPFQAGKRSVFTLRGTEERC
jgi:hypothetical protein